MLASMREQRVGVEIVAEAVAAVEVHDSRAGRCVENAVLGVERHAGPIVGRSRGFVSVFRPGFVTGFARAVGWCERPSGAVRCGGRRPGCSRGAMDALRHATADDDEIFVDDAGRGECYRECAEVGLQAVDDQAFAEIDMAVFSKTHDQLAGFGVEAIEKVHHAGVDATV